MKINIFGYILIIIIMILGASIILNSDSWNLTCIRSKIDGNQYCVRERNKLEMSADLLAKVSYNMSQVVKYCKNNYSDRDNIDRLVNGFNPRKIYETLPNSIHTAYSENKGEKLAFCLDTEKENGKLIDLNTLTFVALHELAHIATESIGHTDEFWGNFKFLIEVAKKINVYSPVDYANNPQRYCGMVISDSPYYDF